MYPQVARLVRLSYVISCAVAIISLLVATASGPLDVPVRTAMVVFASIPPLLFCLAHYFLETLVPVRQIAQGFAFRSFATLGFLLLPQALLSLRYVAVPFDYSQVTQSVAVLAVAAFAISRLFSCDGDTHSLLVLFLAHMRLVMWDMWGSTDARKRLTLVGTARERVWRVRERCYVDLRGLRTFQETLACREIEGSTLGAALGNRFGGRDLKVLDIGGGDGVFTRALLEKLQARVIELRMLDPANWEDQYRKSLSSVIAEGRIVVTRNKFEELQLGERYDLVIAAHSLYAPCDVANGDVAKIERDVIRRLLATRAENGVLAIWLASGRGRSYAFKRMALQRLIGPEANDITAETFHSVVASLKLSIATVDSVIDMTRAFEEMRRGKPEKLDAWLSYFLRVDMDAVPEIERAEVREALHAACVRIDELGEREIEQVLAHRGLDLTRQSVVLPHKTSMFLMD